MEKRKRMAGDGGIQAMEENTMAILDTSGFSSSSKLSHHLDDDRLAFLEAVRTANLLPDNGSAPTRKMFEAVFHILKNVDSLDLIIESYQLLVELEKKFPRVYLSKEVDSSSPSKVISQVIMVEEVWLPFNFGLDSYNEKGAGINHSSSSVDPSGFNALIQEIAEAAKEMKSEAKETTFLKNMLLLQYLITVLDGDFSPRNVAYHESMKWTLLRESQLSMLLGSRKIMYKGLMKDCLSIMCNISQSTEETSDHENSSAELVHKNNSAIALALPDVKKSTRTAVKRFLLMIMELDSSRRIADQQGVTTRADGVRTSAVEIILEELIYNNHTLCSFLQVFDPKRKLEIVVQYFQKYIPKSSVQTRRSSGSPNNVDNFDGVLKCLSNSNITKSIIKKLSAEVVQLLLAYAFQAYLVISKDDKSSSVEEVCKNVVSSFTCLKREDPRTKILCISRQALFAAATILSTRS
ncbi:isoform X1 [Castilleja foliolosa]|uniref:Isoform X1 n=1 Tax=Castilleja foliolosa TaxID=1961234 RepID=A0ABD3BHZ9_9LAMI